LAPLHAPKPSKKLTEREVEILDLIARGLTYQQIGEALTIATSTVQTHIKSIYAKLKVRNKAQAIRSAFGTGPHAT
jgi:DNA-binding NarL/FixJ family response regulator